MDFFVPGYTPSPPDPRDYRLRPYAFVPLPGTFDCPRFDEVPVFEQGGRGACVAHACTSLKVWQELIERDTVMIWSREYLYDRAKERDGVPNEPGTYPRVVLQVLQDLGVCRESLLPYQAVDRQYSRVQITPAMDEDARPQRIVTYARVLDPFAMQQALLHHGPVVIGIPVYANWSGIQRGGVVPKPNGPDLGGHALLVVGWRTLGDQLYFRFRNSWGRSWGNAGDGFLPADYPGLFQDAWLSADMVPGGRIVRGE